MAKKKAAKKDVVKKFKIVVTATAKEIFCGEEKAKYYATQNENCDDVDLEIFDVTKSEKGKAVSLKDFN